MLFVVLLLAVAAVGAGAYLMLFLSHVPGAQEERLGALEALPPELGKWVRDEAPGPDGLIVERRHLFEEGGTFGAGKLTLQVRYRDPATNDIVRIDPDQAIKRRRVRRGA